MRCDGMLVWIVQYTPHKVKVMGEERTSTLLPSAHTHQHIDHGIRKQDCRLDTTDNIRRLTGQPVSLHARLLFPETMSAGRVCRYSLLQDETCAVAVTWQGGMRDRARILMDDVIVNRVYMFELRGPLRLSDDVKCKSFT